MKHAREERPDDWRPTGLSRANNFFIAPFEIVAVSALVVGVFSAASQPFGWQSACQIALYGSLGMLLWWADRQLDLEDEQIAERIPVAVATRRDRA